MATARRTAKNSDYEEKPLTQIAGYVGAAPEVRDPARDDGDEFTSFSVGTNRFYDDENPESTRWYSVAINKPALQDWVLENIKKGMAVVVEGTIRRVEKEVDGETRVYFNMTGFRVGNVDWFISGGGAAGEDYDPDEDL